MTEPPYFGTANEPYEPPPDRPYQPPPYEPPADRLYEPPPDELPAAGSAAAGPVLSATAGSAAAGPVLSAAAGSAAAGSAGEATAVASMVDLRRLRLGRDRGSDPRGPFSFFDFSSDPGTSSDSAYGRSAVDVVHELHLCDNPKVDHGLATCTLADGIGYAIVTTVNDKTEQDEVAADVKDPNEGCTMVVKGYFVTGPDRATLTQALGNLDAFAAQHHGYLAGGCS